VSDPSFSFVIDVIDGETPGVCTIYLSGIIDENADLSFFSDISTDGAVTRLNLKNVRRINSYGVRSWIEAIRSVRSLAPLELHECPPSVVDQINMVAGFAGRGKVISFYAPMACDGCDHEEDRLFFVEDFKKAGKLPDVPCPSCGRRMEVDDLEEQYLLFAREST
jgi:hypothetical protein